MKLNNNFSRRTFVRFWIQLVPITIGSSLSAYLVVWFWRSSRTSGTRNECGVIDGRETNPPQLSNESGQFTPPPPSPVSLYFVPGDEHKEAHPCWSECKHDRSVFHSQWKLLTYSWLNCPIYFPWSSVVLRLAYLIIRISKCKSLNPFTLQRPVTASMFPCSPCDVIFLKGRGQLIYKYLLLGARS